MEPSAIGLKLGVEVLKRTVPSGLTWLSTYFRGKELILVGPSGVGKTSIADYLRYGILEQVKSHNVTITTQKSQTFMISMGRDSALNFRVRRSTDLPGQTGPTAHADYIAQQRPHAVVIVLDASSKIADLKSWIDVFCERLEYHLDNDKALSKKFKGIFVALNKRDLVNGNHTYGAREKAVRKLLLSGLERALGKQVAKGISIHPTIAVQSDDGTASLDTLIRHIARWAAK